LRFPHWSHDGQFIAGTDTTSGKMSAANVVLCKASGGSCRTIAQGTDPHWSADDSTIYFSRHGVLSNGMEIWSVSRDGSNQIHVADLQPVHPIGYFYDVSPTGQIVWVKYQQGKPELWLLEF